MKKKKQQPPADPLRDRFHRWLLRRRLTAQEVAMELHDYDWQKKHFNQGATA